MSWKDKDHPVWRIAQLLILVLLVTIPNAIEAKRFDGDEFRRIVWTVGLLGGAGAAKEKLRL